MTKTLEQVVPASRIESSTMDLSEAIEQCVEKRASQRIQCVRVYGNHYRCNWWVGGEIGVAGRIVKSRFLKVTMNQGALEIEDVTG